MSIKEKVKSSAAVGFMLVCLGLILAIQPAAAAPSATSLSTSVSIDEALSSKLLINEEALSEEISVELDQLLEAQINEGLSQQADISLPTVSAR